MWSPLPRPLGAETGDDPLVCLRSFHLGRCDLWFVKFTRAGDTGIVVGDKKGGVRVCDVATGAVRLLRGDGGVVRMACLGGEEGGKKVVAVGDKGKVEIWEWKK